MVTGQKCYIRQTREVSKYRYKNRANNNLCVKCGSKVNHLKRRCDYCYLRDMIGEIERKLNRLIKFLPQTTDSEKES